MRWAMETSHRAALLRADADCIPHGAIMRAVATVAAGELHFTTGAAIQVDGGMHIHQY
jgi:hypothetical protein